MKDRELREALRQNGIIKNEFGYWNTHIYTELETQNRTLANSIKEINSELRKIEDWQTLVSYEFERMRDEKKELNKKITDLSKELSFLKDYVAKGVVLSVTDKAAHDKIALLFDHLDLKYVPKHEVGPRLEAKHG